MAWQAHPSLIKLGQKIGFMRHTIQAQKNSGSQPLIKPQTYIVAYTTEDEWRAWLKLRVRFPLQNCSTRIKHTNECA